MSFYQIIDIKKKKKDKERNVLFPLLGKFTL